MTSIIIGWCLVGTHSVMCAPYTGCRPFQVPPPETGSPQNFLHVDAAAGSHPPPPSWLCPLTRWSRRSTARWSMSQEAGGMRCWVEAQGKDQQPCSAVYQRAFRMENNLFSHLILQHLNQKVFTLCLSILCSKMTHSVANFTHPVPFFHCMGRSTTFRQFENTLISHFSLIFRL